MHKQISIKTKIGWISVFEENGKIVKLRFGKSKNIGISKNLKHFKTHFNNYLLGKIKFTNSKFHVIRTMYKMLLLLICNKR